MIPPTGRCGEPLRSRRPATGALRNFVSLAVVTLALAGCAAIEEDVRKIFTTEQSGSDIPAPPAPDVQTPARPAVTPPSVTPRPKPSNRAIASAPSDAPSDAPKGEAPTGAGTELSPEAILGLDEIGVARLLGLPGAQHEAPPARIWTYVRDDCAFNVYFYLNLDSETFQALRYDSVPQGTASTDTRECFSQIVAARRQAKGTEG